MFDDVSERDRIKRDIGFFDDKLIKPYIKVIIKPSTDFQNNLEKVKNIVNIISSANEFKEWPDEEWWLNNLPSWFVGSFNKKLKEIEKDKNLWHFGSWVDALKYRQWKWYGVIVKNTDIIIYLDTYDSPCIIGPLEYVFRVAGIKSYEIKEC